MTGKKSTISISMATFDQARHASSDNEIKENKRSFCNKRAYQKQHPLFRRNTVDVMPSHQKINNDQPCHKRHNPSWV